jgi:hypothetical protein
MLKTGMEYNQFSVNSLVLRKLMNDINYLFFYDPYSFYLKHDEYSKKCKYQSFPTLSSVMSVII